MTWKSDRFLVNFQLTLSQLYHISINKIAETSQALYETLQVQLYNNLLKSFPKFIKIPITWMQSPVVVQLNWKHTANPVNDNDITYNTRYYGFFI